MVMMLVLIVVVAVLLLAALLLGLVVSYTLHSGAIVRKQSEAAGSVKLQSSYHRHNSREQHCCMCGNVRKRSFQVPDGVEFSAGVERHCKGSGNLWDIMQPLIESACEKSGFKPGKMPNIKGLCVNRSLFESTEWSKLKDLRSKLQSATSRSASLAAPGSGISCRETPLHSDMPNNLNIEKPASLTSMGSDSSAVSSSSVALGMTSSDAAQDVSLKNGITDETSLKKEPQRRLVLEILLSPSPVTDGNPSQPQRPTGVRLKFETNSSVEHLSNLSAAAAAGSKNEDVGIQTAEGDFAKGEITRIDSAFELVKLQAFDECSLKDDELLGIDKLDMDVTGKAAKQLTVDSEMSAQLHSGEDVKMNMINPMHVTSDFSKPLCEQAVRLHHVAEEELRDDDSPVSSPQRTTLCRFSVPSDLKLATSSIYMAETSDSTQCSAQVTNYVHTSGNISQGIECCNSNLTLQQVPSSSTGTTLSSSEGLGFLQIGSLDSGLKSKSYSGGANADIASALTALAVDSAVDKSPGREGVPCNGFQDESSIKEASPNHVCSRILNTHANHDNSHHEGLLSEQAMQEVDEHHCSLHTENCSDHISAVNSKKEKKKKKNRSKRHKAKASLKANEKDVQAQQETSKSVPVCCKHNTVSVEIGCICGTGKGGIHISNCPYPFTSLGSMIQRKLKEQYDDLVRSNVNKTLTLAQVGRFTTSLVEAKASLQHKSEVVQRKFTIAKSLLCKADKSSFDRICGQIHGLEVDQRRIQEDTLVYNRLQEQLKLSPAYRKMLEYGRAHFELQPNTGQLIEKFDGETMEMSFEELLAQEKKDSFWQKHTPSRPSSVSVI